MKLFLPILAVTAKKPAKAVDGDRGFNPAIINKRTCAEALDGHAFATVSVTANAENNEGTLELNNYVDNLKCYQEIVANEGCNAIQVTLNSVAMEPCGDECYCDQFRYSWTPEGGNELLSAPNCGCVGEGCDDKIVGRGVFVQAFINGNTEDFDEYTTISEDYPEAELGEFTPSTKFAINTNRFKFMFASDMSMMGGNVKLSWECIDQAQSTAASFTPTTGYGTTSYGTTTSTATTTTTTTTTTTYPAPGGGGYYSTTTSSSTTTTYSTTTSGESTTTTEFTTPEDTTCVKYHGGFEAFQSAVEYAIDQAIDDDIESYTKRPGTGKITPGVIFRRKQFKSWLKKPFQKWSEKVQPGYRHCLSDKFPSDSPGDDVGKDILGSDCALNMKNINTICDNLSEFLTWAYDGCRTEVQAERLRKRCRDINRIRRTIKQDQFPLV